MSTKHPATAAVGEGQRGCPDCQKVLSAKSSMKRHRDRCQAQRESGIVAKWQRNGAPSPSVVANAVKVSCPKCGKAVIRGSMRRHNEYFHNGPEARAKTQARAKAQQMRSCKLCGEEFTQGSYLKRHVAAHHSGSTKPDELANDAGPRAAVTSEGDASATFPVVGVDGGKVDEEEKEAEGKAKGKVEKIPPTVGDESASVATAEASGPGSNATSLPCSCVECDEKFANPTDLAVHKEAHHGSCVPGVEALELTTCAPCGQYFVDIGSLEKHIAASHEDGDFPCKDCDVFLMSVGAVSRHERESHNKKFPICLPCEKEFPDDDVFRSHIKVVHADFSCALCDIKCLGMSGLAKHAKEEHSAKARRICRICQVECASNGAPSAHMMKAHATWGYHCDLCGQDMSWYRFEKHLEDDHKEEAGVQGIKCLRCHAACRSREDLRSHMWGAHGMGASRCNVCEREFESHQLLRDHMHSWHVALMYCCPHCPERNKAEAEARAHVLAKHLSVTMVAGDMSNDDTVRAPEAGPVFSARRDGGQSQSFAKQPKRKRGNPETNGNGSVKAKVMKS